MRALVLLALCAGCNAPPELEFTTEHFDFGAVLPGALRQTQVKLRNQGNSRLHVAGTSSSNPAFSLVFPTKSFITPNEALMLSVQHVPPLGATEDETATLKVWTEEGAEATFEATSSPVSPDCTLPEKLEFGAVKRGQSLTLELPLANVTRRTATAEIGAYVGPGGFVVEQGKLAMAPGDEVNVPITFLPGNISKEFTGFIPIQPHQLCETRHLALFGTSVDRFISPEPTALNYSIGFSNTEAQRLTLRNFTLTPITIFRVEAREGTEPSQVFSVLRSPVKIPAGTRNNIFRLVPGEATVEVSFTPAAIQSYIGELVIDTDLVDQPRIEVQLVGAGR